MNNNNTAVDKEKADNPFTTKSEYKIGHTFYTVTTVIDRQNGYKSVFKYLP